jgi:hypothetical protein
MAGKNFCVSYADPRDIDVCLSIGQSVMLDNGAYSLYTRGVPLDPAGFIDWLGDKLSAPHWAVIPDKIGGDLDENIRLINEWPFKGLVSAPVWHMDEPIDHLLRLCDDWPRVCFGSSGKYWDVGGGAWCGRADEAFNALARYYKVLPWIHMMRGLALAGQYWPFASADSVNVARNYKDKKQPPRAMADQIDARQCPGRWVERPTQMELA